MGKNDVSWSQYFENVERFADFVNACGCGGETVFRACDIQELDTRTVSAKTREEKQSILQRDALCRAARGVNFVIIGIEYQETVNYAIPLTCMGYDLGEYKKQLRKIQKRNEDERKASKNPDSKLNQTFEENQNLEEIETRQKDLYSGEFLYKFKKEDLLPPVITFVLYSGEEWNGPKELTDIVDLRGLPESLKGMVSNYKINLIEIRKWEDTSVFKTDLRQVFDFIRCSKDREKLKDLIENNPEYEQLDEQAYNVIKEYAHVTELKVKAEGGKVDMCQALQEIMAEEREIGRREEREKIEEEKEIVRKEEREKIEEERREEREKMEGEKVIALETGRRNIIISALQGGHSPEQVADFNGISMDEVLKVQESLLQQTT